MKSREQVTITIVGPEGRRVNIGFCKSILSVDAAVVKRSEIIII
jgi:hypothetical protein